MLERLKLSVSNGAIAPEVLALDSFVTDCNSVVFDVDHDFVDELQLACAGCSRGDQPGKRGGGGLAVEPHQ